MTGGTGVKPPWIQFPGCDPLWSGWRQGTGEAWLHDTWMPFWHGLSTAERERYLIEWPPPDEEWRLYLTTYWS